MTHGLRKRKNGKGIVAIATPTRSGIAGALAFTDWIWLLFFTAVPLVLCVLADARHLPHGRSRAGDRHLKFYETRDNLPDRSVRR